MSGAMPIGALFSAAGERLDITTTTATVSIENVALAPGQHVAGGRPHAESVRQRQQPEH